MAVSVMSSRSPEHQRLKKILCDFAGVEVDGVKLIGVEINSDTGEIPRFTIEKFAKRETASKALADFDECPEA
jgi:hypothetical protein